MTLKRLYRDFKANLIKNLVFILLIVISVTAIVAFNRSMDSVIDSANRFYDSHHVEDGKFKILGKLTKKTKIIDGKTV